MIFPVSVAVVGGLAAVAVLVMQLRGQLREPALAGSANFDTEAAVSDRGPWRFYGWFAGFIGVVALVGFVAGLAAFFIAFLRVVGRCGWVQTAALAAAAAAFILTLGSSLNLVFPGGVLQAYFDLPWPFR
jgi:hypothetical protein